MHTDFLKKKKSKSIILINIFPYMLTNTNTNTNNFIFNRILKQNNISWKLLFKIYYVLIYANIIQTVYSS